MRRFHRAKNKKDVIDALFREGKGPFSQIWQIIIFATCLGVRIGKREELGECDSSVAIPASVFSNNCQSWPGIAYLIGLVEMRDPSILNPDEETDESRIKIMEEYANAGLEEMRLQLESSEYCLDGIIQLLKKYSDDSSVESDLI
jgi:dnd system-associated protein 4